MAVRSTGFNSISISDQFSFRNRLVVSLSNRSPLNRFSNTMWSLPKETEQNYLIFDRHDELTVFFCSLHQIYIKNFSKNILLLPGCCEIQFNLFKLQVGLAFPYFHSWHAFYFEINVFCNSYTTNNYFSGEYQCEKNLRKIFSQITNELFPWRQASILFSFVRASEWKRKQARVYETSPKPLLRVKSIWSRRL